MPCPRRCSSASVLPEPVVSLSVARGVDGGWEEIVTMMAVTVDDGMVHLELDQLSTDTTYALTFFADDGIRRSRVARFRTAIPAGESRVVRFGASSCLGDVDEPWPSLSYSWDERLDFFLLLGDTIYADNNPDAFNFDAKYETALSLYGLNDLTAGTSVVATWDDHEVDNNWSWSDAGIQQLYDDALAGFRKYIPQARGAGGRPVAQALVGRCRRSVRALTAAASARTATTSRNPRWTGSSRSCRRARAAFKVILNSVPIFDFTGTVIGPFSTNDRWQGYPDQRNEILGHIDTAGITGVLWVAGDVHFGAVGKADAPGGPGENQWEVITGPAGSFVNVSALLLPVNERMPVVVTEHNWVLFEADPDAGTMSVKFIDDANQVIGEQLLTIGVMVPWVPRTWGASESVLTRGSCCS